MSRLVNIGITSPLHVTERVEFNKFKTMMQERDQKQKLEIASLHSTVIELKSKIQDFEKMLETLGGTEEAIKLRERKELEQAEKQVEVLAKRIGELKKKMSGV